MIRVSSTEFGKEVGRYQDVALSEPVSVPQNGGERKIYAADKLPAETRDSL